MAQDFKHFHDHKDVKPALMMIDGDRVEKNAQDAKNLKVSRLYDNGFKTMAPTGLAAIASKTLVQGHWGIVTKSKPLDWVLEATKIDTEGQTGFARSRSKERIVTSGVATIMRKGNWHNVYRNGGGIADTRAKYGDAFVLATSNPKSKEAPIAYQMVSSYQIFKNNGATAIRSNGAGRSAMQLGVIVEMSVREFKKYYPDYKDQAKPGRIPREYNREFDVTKYKVAEGEEEQHIMEVMHYFDLVDEKYVIIAGANCVPMKVVEGKKYPFRVDGDPIIPVLQFPCIPNSGGFYNYGMGNFMYDLAKVSEILANKEYQHLGNNVNPLSHIMIPKGSRSSYLNSLFEAEQQRAAGKHAFVPIEYDPNDPNGGRIDIQTLQTQNNLTEWQIFNEYLDQQYRRLGIMLDDAQIRSNPTATEILFAEENSSTFVRQVGENGASEEEMAVRIAMDGYRSFVSKSDKTPINLTTGIDLDSGRVGALENITYGMVAEELKTYNWWPRMNDRSGNIPSNVIRNQEVSSGLSVATPGTRGHGKLLNEFFALRNLDVTADDMTPDQSQVPQEQVAQQPTDQGGGQLPGSQNERGNINPKFAKSSQI